jgi:hypothetical protein
LIAAFVGCDDIVLRIVAGILNIRVARVRHS